MEGTSKRRCDHVLRGNAHLAHVPAPAGFPGCGQQDVDDGLLKAEGLASDPLQQVVPRAGEVAEEREFEQLVGAGAFSEAGRSRRRLGQGLQGRVEEAVDGAVGGPWELGRQGLAHALEGESNVLGVDLAGGYDGPEPDHVVGEELGVIRLEGGREGLESRAQRLAP